MVDVDAFLDAPCKLKDFIDALPVAFLLLLDDFEGPVLLTEDSVDAFTFLPVDFHEVIGASCTLYVEGDVTLATLALYTSTLILLAADDTLPIESFIIDFIQTDRCFRRDNRPRNPHSTA